MRIRLPLGLACTLTLLAACGGASSGMPRHYGRLRLGADSLCPSVAGHYFNTSDPITTLLVPSAIRRSPAGGALASFTLSAPTDSVIEVVATYHDGESRESRLRRGGPYHGDYYCEDGWLKIGDARVPSTWDREVRRPDFQPRRHELWVAPNSTGSLVGRLRFIHFEQFDVWCGDGCKGFPLPWTFRFRHTWSQAEPYDADRPPPPPPEVAADDDGWRDDRSEALNERVRLENEALENGTPLEPYRPPPRVRPMFVR